MAPGSLIRRTTAATTTATITTGYSFDGWSDGTPDNPRTITVTSSETFTVECTHISYTISASVSPSGTGTVSGAGNYYYGDTCTLTVTPEEGYLFTQWNDGNTSNPRTITVTGSATYTATIEVDTTNYFYILPESNGTLAYVTKRNNNTPSVTKTIQYSTDKTNWSNLTGTGISITAGQKVYLISSTTDAFTNYVSSSSYRHKGIEVSNTNYSIGGDIMSLFNSGNTLPSRALQYFFYQEYGLISATSLLLPSYVSNYCYDRMFAQCTHLTGVPTLPATSLSYFCYGHMFNNCSALTTPPALPATTLATNCYSGMFNSCSNLTTLPQLPATSLPDSCYNNMFDGTGMTLAIAPSSTKKNIFRVPMVGTGTTGTNSLYLMFGSSGVSQPTANTVYFVNGTSPYYNIYWDSSLSWSDENWDVMGSSINVDFYCDGVLYNQIYCSPDGGLDYKNTVSGVTLTACDYQTGWVSEQYRAIYYTSEKCHGIGKQRAGNDFDHVIGQSALPLLVRQHVVQSG